MAQRHYLWYDADGRILGISPGHYGWETDDLTPLDPDAPGGSHAMNVREYMLDLPSAEVATLGFGLIGGVESPCACELGVECRCADDVYADYYVDTGGPTLVEKTALTILVDDVAHPTNNATPFARAPGSLVTLKVQGALPDGTQLTLGREGAITAQSDPVLTFTGGETNTVTLTAPGQGQVGGVVGISKLLRPVWVMLLGWA